MAVTTLPPLQAFKAYFDATTWERGEAYARQHSATAIELIPNDPAPGWWTLLADVQGSEPSPYEVAFQFKILGSGKLALDSDCSCPVGSRCKHTVATVIQALSQEWGEPLPTSEEAASSWPFRELDTPPTLKRPEPSPHESLERWLRARDMSRQIQPTIEVPAQEGRLVYVLSSQPHESQGGRVSLPDSGVAQWLCLWPAKTRPVRNKPDQWHKPGLLKRQYGGLFSEDEGLTEVFKMMRRWLQGQFTGTQTWGYTQQRKTLGPPTAVQDLLGLQVLQAALRTGEVVTLNEHGQIEHTWQWGPPRQLTWGWVALPERPQDTVVRWHARADLGSPACELRLGSPALYLDRETHTVGEVETRQNVLQLADWLSLPPMPEDWMRERMERLLPFAPPLPVAVIGEIARTIQDVAPTAHLRVGRAPADVPGMLALHLSLVYDGVQGVWPLDAQAEQWIETAQGRVLLHRQPELEKDWMNVLLGLGYLPPLMPQAPSVWTAARMKGTPGLEADPKVRDRALLADDLRPLRERGFVITFDAEMAARMRTVQSLDMGLDALSADGTVIEPDEDAGTARWFGLSMGFEVDGQRVNLLPWLPQLLNHITRTQHSMKQPADERLWLLAEPDQWWHVPVAPLRPWLATMLELMGERPHHAMQGSALRLDRFQAMRLAAHGHPGGALALSGAQASSLGTMVQALREGDHMAEVEVPEGLHAELRPYQRHGVAWLQFLARHQLGGVLADDMGLGKTLQTIAHLWVEKQNGRLQHPALVVAPTSVVGNWRSELHRFAPGLRTLVLHGAQRDESFAQIPHSDVVLTTYPLLTKDQDTLTPQPWSVLVLDEAQTIKNAKTLAAGVVQTLNARQRLCLSGTPMENHLGEIWSLFHFLMPGYLGSDTRFKQLFRTPIEKHGDMERLTLLRARLAPFMLRRGKALVAAELPPKVETVEHVTLMPTQAKLYETIRLTTEQKVREALSDKGLARSHITVLDALLKLRQVCCDPRLVPLAATQKVKESAKLDWLVQNLPEMIAEGRRVLLFSQFTSMLDLIEEELPALGLSWARLTGQSKGRDAIIERFTSGQVPLFLISLKAGGVGLNLPQADTVIHYDPWWNPAVEDQATDRAHRLGQTQTVFVHKLVAEGTLEERILSLQARKAELAKGLYGTAGAIAAALTESDLDWLLQPLSAGIDDGAKSCA